MTAKIFVGFRTRLLEGAEKQVDRLIVPDKRLTDKTKIAADIAQRKEQFLIEAKSMPYYGTFDKVFIAVEPLKKVGEWIYDPDKPICLRVRNFLLKYFPDAWANETHTAPKIPEAIFVGFNPRLFLKLLGLECSLPKHKKPCPLRMWYNNSDHRDIEEAVCPSDFKKLDVLAAVNARRPLDPAEILKWDSIVKDWTAPHEDPEKDVCLSIVLADQLGFLD